MGQWAQRVFAASRSARVWESFGSCTMSLYNIHWYPSCVILILDFINNHSHTNRMYRMYSPYLIFSIYSFGGAWQLKWAGKDCWSAAFRHFAGDIVIFPEQMAIATNHTPLRAWRTSLPFTLFTFQYWIQNQLIFMHDLSTSWCIILLDTDSKWLKFSVSGTFAGEKRSIGLLATCEGVARIWRCWSGRRKTGRRKWSKSEGDGDTVKRGRETQTCRVSPFASLTNSCSFWILMSYCK